MLPKSFHEVSGSLSSERFAAYRKPGEDDLTVLTRYVWNMQLCEALYPALQCFEVALRNRLHNAIARKTQNPAWLHSTSPLLLTREQDSVQKACDELRHHKKPVEQGRLIAELMFGFWTGLLGGQYHSLWPKPQVLQKAFPGLPATNKPRQVLAARCTEIRHLRNRVFHHEPIWNDPKLAQKHQDLLNAIGWICPATARMTQTADRFAQVSSSKHRDDLRRALDASV